MAEEQQQQQPDLAALLATFKTDLLSEFDKRVNSTNKEMKDLRKLIETKKAEEPPPTQKTEQKTEEKGEPGGLDPQVNARILAAEKKAADAQKLAEDMSKERETERAARLETERTTAIKDELAKLSLRDGAREDAYWLVERHIKRDESGSLVADSAKGPLPIKDFIESTINEKPWLLAPSGNGGSGAQPGKPGGKGTVQIEYIKPGMTPEQIAAASAAIAQSMST
jgi:hypothetical protein